MLVQYGINCKLKKVLRYVPVGGLENAWWGFNIFFILSCLGFRDQNFPHSFDFNGYALAARLPDTWHFKNLGKNEETEQ